MASGRYSSTFGVNNFGKLIEAIVEWQSIPDESTVSSTVTVTTKIIVTSGVKFYTSKEGNNCGVYINDIFYSYTPKSFNSQTSNGQEIVLGTVTSKAISHNSNGTKTINIRWIDNSQLTFEAYSNTYTNTFGISNDSFGKNITLDLIIPEKNRPTLDIVVEENNNAVYALTGDKKKLVKYHSNAIVNVSAEAKNGASINLDTLVIRNGSRTAFSSPAIFNNVEVSEFSASIEDSNGISGTKTISVPIVEYIRLTCNLERSELDTAGVMTIDCSGNYFNQSFGATNNSLTVQYRYKTQDGTYGSWQNMSISYYQNTYTASASVSGLNYREKYVIQCRAIDKLNEVSTPEVVVKSLPVFHWSENDFVFEVPVVFNAGASGADIEIGGGSGSGSSSGIIEGNATIGGDCLINGNLRLKGSGNYGNSLYFGDGSYAMISESSDDTLVIKATNIELNGSSSVKLNGSPIGYGTWIPTLNNSSAVSSYGVRQGWYSRMGNVITIGWQLKATINSGYSSTSLSISGVPFTPAYAAFGGGVAHNINVSAGFNFEGWTIGTDGAITAKTQPCNGTSAGNLQISSTAYYPTGSGNTLTLAGTICYVIN